MRRDERNAREALSAAGIDYPSDGVVRAAVALDHCAEEQAGARETREARAELARMLAESGEAEHDTHAEELAGLVLAELASARIDHDPARGFFPYTTARYGGFRGNHRDRLRHWRVAGAIAGCLP